MWLLAAGNLLAFFLMFSLLLEYCRLRFKRRALGFVVLWLFILCFLPLILAAVFTSETLAKLSFLAPGAAALFGSNAVGLKCPAYGTAAHFGVVALLFIAWLRQWKLLLSAPASVPPARAGQN